MVLLTRSRLAGISAGVLLSLVGGSGALAQWTSDASVNTPVCTAPGDQTQPKIKRAPDGSFRVSWFDNRSGGNDVYIQKLSSAGVPEWTADGVLIADRNQSSTNDYDLEIDADGNAFVAFGDDRQGGSLKATVAKVSPSGTILWQRNMGSAGTAFDPRLLVMGDNSVICAYIASVTGPNNSLIEMYRLNATDGTDVWAGNGRVTVGEPSPVRPYNTGDLARADGDNFWMTIRRATGTGFTAGRHVYYQKFSGAGAAQLPTPGAPTAQLMWNTDGLSIAFYPPAISDGSGGLFTAWYSGPSSNFKNRVQRVNSAGVLQYATPPQGSTGGSQANCSADFIPSTGDMFLCWPEKNANQSLTGVGAQRFDADGNAQWGTTGFTILALGATDKSFVQGVASESGGYSVFWFDYVDAVNFKVRGTRITQSGNNAWSPDPIIDINSNVNPKGRLASERDGAGVVLAWHENRSGSNDIFVQRVTADGTLGVDLPQRCSPADIAYDNGDPLPPIGVPGGTNNGVTEGDYNAFFSTFFDAGALCDIANDDGSPLPPFGVLATNNGTTEADYNLFFAIYFDGCPS
jgi:hypothetical protein